MKVVNDVPYVGGPDNASAAVTASARCSFGTRKERT
jgi:hypothetical protein